MGLYLDTLQPSATLEILVFTFYHATAEHSTIVHVHSYEAKVTAIASVSVAGDLSNPENSNKQLALLCN